MSSTYWSERWGARFNAMMQEVLKELQSGDEHAFVRFVRQQWKRHYTVPSLRTPAAGQFAPALEPALAVCDAAAMEAGLASASGASASEPAGDAGPSAHDSDGLLGLPPPCSSGADGALAPLPPWPPPLADP